ncbi:MAG: DUF5611 family protein [Candidatus Methanoplasma sp.]|jgi:hypothetical protein|nr:DUF5611 family protein [Candidatus Methanoplasma sp.]
MVEYDIKKGWFKNIDGDLLKNMMKEVFGNVSNKGDALISSYGVLESISVRVVSKEVMEVVTVSMAGSMADADILDSKRKLNEFVERATGFDAKARMKRAQAKAKKGEL